MSYFAPRKVTGHSLERKRVPMSPKSKENYQAAIRTELPATTNMPSLADELAQAEEEMTPSIESSPAASPKLVEVEQETAPSLETSPAGSPMPYQTTTTVEPVHFRYQTKAYTDSVDSTGDETLTNSAEEDEELPEKLPLDDESDFDKDDFVCPDEKPRYSHYNRPRLGLLREAKESLKRAIWVLLFTISLWPRGAKESFQRAISVLLFVIPVWICYSSAVAIVPFIFQMTVILVLVSFVLARHLIWVTVKAALSPFVIGRQILEGVMALLREAHVEEFLTFFHLATGVALTVLLATGFVLNKKRYHIFAGIIILTMVLHPIYLAVMAVFASAMAIMYAINKGRYVLIFGFVVLITLAAVEIQTVGLLEASLWWARSSSGYAWTAHLKVADFYRDYTRWVLKKSGTSGSLAHAYPLGLEFDDKFVQFTDAQVKGTFLQVQFILLQVIAPFLARVFLSIHFLALGLFGSMCFDTCVSNRWPHWCAVYFVWDRLSWNREFVRYLWSYGFFWYKDVFRWWQAPAQVLDVPAKA